MDKNLIISNSYNSAIEEGFNQYLEERAVAENSEIKIDEEALIADIEGKWLATGLQELDGMTPLEFINSLSSLEDLLEFFLSIASASDVGVPDILIDRFKYYGGKTASDKLFHYVNKSLAANENNRDDIYPAVSQAVYAIGCLQEEEYKQKLIDLLIENAQDEMISEAICAAIVAYGVSILDDVIKAFDAVQNQTAKEHFLVCVAEICNENKYRADEIFFFMKNVFRTVSNLTLIVEILGDYGDGRAIPLLRGHVLKNIHELDAATFNQMRAIIKKLGGEIEDLVYTK